MTLREKLKQEHPECVDEGYEGGCRGCPDDYGYSPFEDCGIYDCRKCWDREMPKVVNDNG